MTSLRFTAHAALLCLTLSLPSFAAEDDPVEWLGDYKQAIQEAKRTQKPIFLEYRCEP